MKEPNWEEAPEWATHALTTGPTWDGADKLTGTIEFARFFDGAYLDVRRERFVIGKDAWIVLSERPAAWTGDGLPPVGMVCEVENEVLGDWDRVDNVLAHSTVRGSDVAVFQRGDMISYAFEGNFRPLRTPEQLVLEERNQRVSEIMGIVKGLDLRFLTDSHAHHVAIALYDAGLRFPEGGAQ